ncbi:hypothetical protein GCM10022251_30930 [Phytohabitans flavus]|uniref:Polymerase nucleotidyl transferase domain-containing protein n=1 Tax=Phytohabitans flavus TaxID=1076124 RepID=A0A6F8XWZ6_9ACTN|nr:nucleotidyltransferase domain-containing protein [Phytohabitans flavus]BCB78317.1 hypothetical protein Pflav_047270 [Phytohabitans flavus]
MIGAADVDRVVQRVVAGCDPDRIDVFGSYAKGTAHAGSDLDLLVIGPSEDPPWLRGRDLHGALRMVGVRLDLLFVTPQELASGLAQSTSFLGRILASARTVYRRPGGAA